VSERRQGRIGEEEHVPFAGGATEWELEFDLAKAGAGVGGVGGVKRQVYRVRGEEEADWVGFRARGNQERAVPEGHNGKKLLGAKKSGRGKSISMLMRMAIFKLLNKKLLR
jgi:hypothetical protein